MSLKHLTAALAATIALAGTAAAAPAAHASVGQELQAGGVVERLASRHWRSYDFIAACDQYSRGRFWCDVSGQSGDCYRQGHADVKRSVRRDRSVDWYVWWRGMGQDCF
jgi:hypothetical protein